MSSTGTAYWYLTRSTGVVALLLLSAVVVLGTLGPMRLGSSPRWPRFAIGTLHRDLSLLVVIVLVIHIATTVLDGFAPIGWLDAVIPFRSSYRPLWLGFGALACDLLLALVFTSLIRVRLGQRRWRAVHWLAYVSWPVAMLHGLGTGSDADQSWMLIFTAICAGAVLSAFVARVHRDPAPFRSLRTGWLSLAFVTPVALAVFAAIGPLSPGWAQRAGTPAALLHPAERPTAAAAPVTRSSSATVVGRLKRSRVHGGALIDLTLALEGGARGVVRIRLAGRSLAGGGISLLGSQVDFSDPSLGVVLGGTVISLNGDDFRARVTGAGQTIVLDAELRIDQQSDRVSGLLRMRSVPA
jgi:sulfoxide reductase heme-binding subunit YedZ